MGAGPGRRRRVRRGGRFGRAFAAPGGRGRPFASFAPTPAADVPLHPLQPLAQVGHPLLRPFGLDLGPPEFVQRPGQYGFTFGLTRFFFLAPRPAARRRRAVRPPRRFGRPGWLLGAARPQRHEQSAHPDHGRPPGPA